MSWPYSIESWEDYKKNLWYSFEVARKYHTPFKFPRSSMDNDISGPYLTENGWQRKASVYTKGEDVITYDGCDWFLNGKRIFTINDVP